MKIATSHKYFRLILMYLDKLIQPFVDFIHHFPPCLEHAEIADYQF